MTKNLNQKGKKSVSGTTHFPRSNKTFLESITKFVTSEEVLQNSLGSLYSLIQYCNTKH